MYRIISGTLKGKRISAPKNFDLRPTTDFAKEGLFNILENRFNFQDIRVLDLYAGIGSISFEFSSRGVPVVKAVESNFIHAQFIEQKAAELGIDNQIQVLTQSAQSYVAKSHDTFDVVFADPPFDTSKEEYQSLINEIFEHQLVNPNGLVIVEHNSRLSLEDLKGFQEKRKYGNVSFSFFNRVLNI